MEHPRNSYKRDDAELNEGATLEKNKVFKSELGTYRVQEFDFLSFSCVLQQQATTSAKLFGLVMALTFPVQRHTVQLGPLISLVAFP